MKKSICIVVLLLTSLFGMAQEKHKVYCEIIGTGNVYGITGKVQIYFGGDLATKIDKQTFIVDKNNKYIKFASMIDAVTYLSKLGWELLNGYQATETQGTIKVTAYHYILFKNVISDNEIAKGIKRFSEPSISQIAKEPEKVDYSKYDINVIKAKLEKADPNSSEYYELKDIYDHLKQ